MGSISKRKNVAKTKSSKSAGNRRGEKRSDSAKPGGTNVSRSGGTASKKAKAGASGARGKGARST